MFQRITSTDFNRYPGIFRTMQALMRERHGPGLNGSRLRILSFGCSEGHEMQSIRCYFPHAFIYGCDVNRQVLRKARKALANDRFAHVFLSEEKSIVENGPYDLVFAMSVFCQYPQSKKVDNIDAIFPFTKFRELAGLLCLNLAPGGVFCLMNSSYLFRDLDLGEAFQAIRSPLQPGNGFIDKFDRNGARLTTSFGSRKMYSHRREALGIDDDDLIDCMFQYLPDGFSPATPSLPEDEPAGFKPMGEPIRISCECLDKAIREKRAAMRLTGQAGVDEHGDWWGCAMAGSAAPWTAPSPKWHRSGTASIPVSSSSRPVWLASPNCSKPTLQTPAHCVTASAMYSGSSAWAADQGRSNIPGA